MILLKKLRPLSIIEVVVLIIIVLLMFSLKAKAQEPNFSMYHYAPFFTNPGMIGTQEDVSLMLNYRNQAIEAGESFRASSVSGYYPIYFGNHRLVIAGNFLNDQIAEFVETNGGLLGVAYSIRTSSKSELSFGLQSGLFQRGINNDFTTDDQFVDGVFDPNAVSGDAILNQTRSYPTLSLGLHYRLKDEQGRDKAFIGGAFFNAIEPDISLLDVGEDKLPASIRASAGLRVYQGYKFSVMPTVRVVNQDGNNFSNIGSRFGYELDNSDEGTKKVELGLWYNTNDLGVFSIAYEQPNLTIGVSYDLPVGTDLSTAQNGIFELAVSFRIKKKSRPFLQKQKSLAQVSMEENNDTEETVASEEIGPIVEQKEEIEQPRPVEEVEEEVNEGPNKPLNKEERETLSKTVRFELSSDELTSDSRIFLDEVAGILIRKEGFQIELVGHTCSLGSEKLNADLSLERAKQVKAYLVSKGIAPGRFLIRGAGESNPLNAGDTEEARIGNRRVEFRVVE